MKGKVVNISLLLVVAAIWGYIGFSVYQAFSDEDEPSYSPTVFKESIADSSQQIFSINPQYRDPFLKNIPSQKKSSNPSRIPLSRSRQTKNQDIPAFNSERIQFTGVVSGIDNRMKAIISLDEKNYLIEVGQIVNDIEIIQITTDSIQAKWEKQKFWIKKEGINPSY
ncbi:hypothetical protein QWY31_08130 [Cytophagales bacterium LB-30]|uniref:Pilus assembly protein PilP n=1 Tax=Shiella aurantiaca TaxID=3058365 RepID=A0ABT8F5C0_9BACT|nr:hypothetical protein [Shiella aurantiaca]MDN4165464.1 hypothetical protein [Shiella aurantiaca]